jgi:hypothetical protein
MIQSCLPRRSQRTAEMGGFRSFVATAANGEVAPMNEPARAGGEHASCSAYFYEVDAR